MFEVLGKLINAFQINVHLVFRDRFNYELVVMTEEEKATTLACAFSSIKNFVTVVLGSQTLVKIRKLVSEDATEHVFEFIKFVKLDGYLLIYDLDLTVVLLFKNKQGTKMQFFAEKIFDLCILPFVQMLNFDLLESQGEVSL